VEGGPAVARPAKGGPTEGACAEGGVAPRARSAAIGTALIERGVAVQDDFLPSARVRRLLQCAGLRRDRGEFGEARIGTERLLQRREAVRGDRTCWLAPPRATMRTTMLFPEEAALLADLELLRLDINQLGFLGLFDLELHHAWYPPGASYARHVDQLHGREQRVVSVVLYLNEDWRPDAGGELRLFDGTAVRDIAPVAGRLVCFLTAGLEHAVLECRRERSSISGWFRRRDDRLQA
jgi:SM-20-related protein